MRRTRAQELDRALSALHAIPCPPSHSDWWPIVGSAVDAGVPEDSIRAWCMAGPGFNEADFRTVYRSLARRPRSGKEGSLFKIARANGWRDTTAALSPSLAEQELKWRESERISVEASAKQVKIRTDAAKKAVEAWSAGSASIMSHGYYLKKTLDGRRQLCFGEGVRRGPWPQNRWNDALLVPIYDINSKIMSLEAISSSGDKMALKGGAKSGGLYPLARFTTHKSGVVVIAEGLATAAACMQATGFPAVAAFCDSNLKKVAEICRSKRPALQIVIAADIGSEDMARAAAEAVGGIIAIPSDIPEIERGTDFWDIWATADGPSRVKKIIENARNAAILKGKVVPVPERRDIQILPGDLPAAVDQAEASLIEQCDDIFQRAGIIVRPVQALVHVANGQTVCGVRLSAVDKYHLAERLTGAANWWKRDLRAADLLPTDCPLSVAQTYMSRDGSWRLKTLEGVITASTLRPDGSILDTMGYDDQTGLLLYGDQSKFKPISDIPSKEDAQKALGHLLDLIAGFPFVHNHDRSVALSGILTACIRGSLPTAPMHGYSAPTAGSGKSMLVDLASIIASGREAAVMSQGRDESEQEKRLASALMAGDQVITIDNVTLPIEGDLLCQVLTQESVRMRVLGASVLRTMPTKASFFATGNNLVFQGDITRRALVCSLDPECERPEKRTFDNNPREVAKRNRAALLQNALTILRAFHVAGRPQPAASVPFGGFEVWSQWVRGALLWLDQADPVQTVEMIRASDLSLEAKHAVISQWRKVIGEEAEISVKDVISKATEPKHRAYSDNYSNFNTALSPNAFLNDDLREALLAVAGIHGSISPGSLGKWLAANVNRRFSLNDENGEKSGSFRFVKLAKTRHNVAIWKLEKVGSGN